MSTASSTKPAVLHVISGLYTGGAENMLLKLVQSNALGDRRHVVVALRGGGGMIPRFRAAGVDTRELHVRGPKSFLRGIVHLRRMSKQIRPGVVCGWMYHGNLAASLAAVRLAPVVWNIRQSLYDIDRERTGTRYAIRLCGLLSKRPSAVIYNSQVSRSQHSAVGFESSRSCVIPNGFDLDTFRPDESIRQRFRELHSLAHDAPVVGMVARRHPMKDHETFIAACRQVSCNVPSARFVLVGRGLSSGPQEVRSLLAAAGLDAVTTVIDEMEDMSKVYPGLDLLCLTSRWGEAFPNVIGEAMACGVPCVTTSVGDAPLIVGDTGRVSGIGDDKNIAHNIIVLLGDAAERQRLGRAARQRVVDHFSIEAVAARFRRVLVDPVLSS